VKVSKIATADDVLKIMAELETNDYGEPVRWHASVLAFLIFSAPLPDEYLGSFSSLLDSMEKQGLLQRVKSRDLTFWRLTDKKIAE